MRLRLLICLSLFCFFSTLSRAESVTVYNIGSDDAYNSPMINDAGVVLLQTNYGCEPGSYESCYVEFTHGVQTYYSAVAPSDFVADDGTSCAAPYGSLGQSVCNGGYHVFDVDREILEAFPGGDPFGQSIVSGSADVVRLNSTGDFLVFDGLNKATYQVIVSSTPEPSSFALLATGLAGVAGVVRRRFA